MISNTRELFESLSPKQKALVLKKLQAGQTNNKAAQVNKETSLVAVERKQPLRPSLNQENLWLLYQLEGNSAYHTFVPIEFKQWLHIPTLARSLTEIVRRHESLRTTFVFNDGELTQVIAPAGPVVLPIVDLTHVGQNERTAMTQRLANAEAAQPFDLATGPLLRMRLLHFADDHYVLLITMHHIITDGQSLGIFFKEFSLLYQAYLAGKPSPLSDLPLQHADFAHWQRQWLQGERFAQQLGYWRQQLAGLPPLLELPTDAPRPAVPTTVGATHKFVLPSTLVAAVERLSQQQGTTLFMTLLAAFNVLLSRYSNQEDIAVGTPVANRPHQDLDKTIGFFANTLTLRTDLAGDPTVAELLTRVKQTTLAAIANQDMPFGEVVKALCPQRNLSHSPLFQVMFAFHSYAILPDSAPTFAFSYFEHQQMRAMFDLTLECFKRDDLLQCQLEYSTTLFQPATIARMAAHFLTLLQAIVANPNERIVHLPLLTVAERQQLLFTWNEQTAPYIQTESIHHVIERRVREHPDAPAVVYYTNQVETEGVGAAILQRAVLSYGELNQQADQLAAYLQLRGIGPETIVAVCLERSQWMLVALLGILKAGGAYVALDPEYPDERLAWTLADTGSTILLTQASLVKRFAVMHGTATPITTVCLDTDWSAIAGCGHALQAVDLTPDHLAYLIYTSGSTGQPKGVMGTHRNLLNLLQIAENAHAIQPHDNILQMANFAFSVFVADWVRALCTGATLVICPRPWLLLPDKLAALIKTEAITCGDFVPAVLRHLVQSMQAQGTSLTNMRLMIVGSDSWHTHEYQAFRHICGETTRLINAYGMTETTVDSCSFEQAAQPLATSDLMPIGRPFANVQIYILDQQQQPVPIGVPGELYIGGLGVARGYLNRLALTQEKFIPNPFGTGRLYRTGDRARYRHDGVIEFLGRVDNQVKIRGFRVELGEIEATLLQEPTVQEAVVLLREQAGERYLVAYIVPQRENVESETDQTNQVSRYRTFLQEHLPNYMVPAFFVLLDALPLTANGKVDRGTLPEPAFMEMAAAEAFVAPRTPLERRLAALWMKALHLETISVHADFFALGGHSLLAAQVVHALQQDWGQTITLATLFQQPTLAQLAQALAQAPDQPAQPAPSAGPLVALQPLGERTPFFCVHGVGGDVVNYYQLARSLGANQPFYGLRAVGLDGQRAPQRDLVAMASDYIAAIRCVQTQGPYLIGGHSFGGEVAFVMARQLQQQGETVALLVLLDSYAPHTLPQYAGTDDDRQRFVAAAYYVSAAMGSPIRLREDELAAMQPAQWSAVLRNQLQAAGRKLPTTGHSQPIEAALQVCQANLAMHHDPSPQLTVPTLLIHAATIPQELRPFQKNAMGWHMLITSPIEVQCTPGDHFTMLNTPHVQTLAMHLQRCFQRLAKTRGD